MAYKRKTTDEYQVLANYGYGHGWEVVSTEPTPSDVRARVREYRENSPQYSYKWMKVRVKIQEGDAS